VLSYLPSWRPRHLSSWKNTVSVLPNPRPPIRPCSGFSCICSLCVRAVVSTAFVPCDAVSFYSLSSFVIPSNRFSVLVPQGSPVPIEFSLLASEGSLFVFPPVDSGARLFLAHISLLLFLLMVTVSQHQWLSPMFLGNALTYLFQHFFSDWLMPRLHRAPSFTPLLRLSAR